MSADKLYLNGRQNFGRSNRQFDHQDVLDRGDNDDDMNRRFSRMNLNGSRDWSCEASRGCRSESNVVNNAQQWPTSDGPRKWPKACGSRKFESLPSEVEESVCWFSSTDKSRIEAVVALKQPNCNWMTMGKRKLEFDYDTAYCPDGLIPRLLGTKNAVFAGMSVSDRIDKPRNIHPYECRRLGGFCNPWSLKVANIDRIADFMFSGENEEKILKKSPLDGSRPDNCDREKELFYFADVCGGPGGFSEYMLWRKGFYNAKGFGFTEKGEYAGTLFWTEDWDWNMEKFMRNTNCFFERFYGRKGTGDICDADNIDEFEEHIWKETSGRGVDLMMSDAFVPPRELVNFQEILMKRLYLCEMLISLCIVKDGGNYLSTIFDVFTPFSFLLCLGLKKEVADVVKEYLKSVNQKLAEVEHTAVDVIGVVPDSVLRGDVDFTRYIYEKNEMRTKSQLVSLEKYHNPPVYDKDELKCLRRRCLEYWMVPSTMPTADYVSPQGVVEKYLGKELSTRWLNESLPFFTMLVSTMNGIFTWNNVWDRFTVGRVRIPIDTILLVDVEGSNFGDGRVNKPRVVTEYRLIRVQDAFVLYGDNVFELTYEERMRAARKMCQALKSEYAGDDEFRLTID